MNAIDRAIGWVAPQMALRRAEARTALAVQQRSYDAGRPTRSTAGWRRPFTSARSETYAALPYVRASAHDLVRNNPHAAKVVGSLAVDLIGTGIVPKANTGNKRLNKRIDAVAKRFFAEMDADGITKNYAGFQLLAARALLEGGEAIFRRYVRPTSIGLHVPLQFSLLESEYLDNTKNFVQPNGNRVQQGIEFDPRTRLREAYHLFREHPGDTFMAAVDGSYQVDRIPAADVRIMYEPQRPGQIRGVPWITPILVRAKMLDDYEDAERQRKRTESSIPLIVKANTQVGEASENNGSSLFPTLTDADGRMVEAVQAGLVAYMRDGSGVEVLKPVDAMGYSPYKRTELQSIAAGARSTYETASGDLSQTNYSSFQAGQLGYRGMVDVIRATIVIPDLEWIWRCMIDMAIAAGRLPDQTPYDVEHHCPPWLPIDPEKQANADLIDIRSGKKTLKKVITAQGIDFEAHLDELEEVNKALDKRKIILDSDPRRTDKRGVEQQAAAEAKGNAPPPPEDNPDQA